MIKGLLELWGVVWGFILFFGLLIFAYNLERVELKIRELKEYLDDSESNKLVTMIVKSQALIFILAIFGFILFLCFSMKLEINNFGKLLFFILCSIVLLYPGKWLFKSCKLVDQLKKAKLQNFIAYFSIIIFTFLLLYAVWDNRKEAKLDKIKAEGYAEMEKVLPCKED